MTDLGIVAAYEVRWHWLGEITSLRYPDHDAAVRCAIVESMDWTSDTVPGSREATQHRRYKRVSLHAIGASRRRSLLATYENGKVIEGEWE